MAKFVLTNTRIFAGGTDLTSNSNKVEIDAKYEDKDVTAFGGDGWKSFQGGIASGAIQASGQWEALDLTKVDDALWAQAGALGPWSVYPAGNQLYANTAAVGDLVYFTNALECSYVVGGSVGDVAPWASELYSSWPVVRGIGLHPPGTARTTTGNGTATQHVATATGKYLYAALHVISISGTSTPTITVSIESDATNSFSGAQTTRFTFNAATSLGGQILRVAGPITDTWFRPKWTISGTSPSFLFTISLGIA